MLIKMTFTAIALLNQRLLNKYSARLYWRHIAVDSILAFDNSQSK